MAATQQKPEEQHDTSKAAMSHYDSFMQVESLVSDTAEVVLPTVGTVKIPIVKGDFKKLPIKVQKYIAQYFHLMHPKAIFLVDGSEEEAEHLREKLVKRGMLFKQEGMDNCFLCRTDPADVARVEGKTFLVSDNKYDSVPHVAEGVQGVLGRHISPEEFDKSMGERFPGCMKGRMMYVIPYSMGPVGGPLSKIGVQLTDSSYIVLSMGVMTRVGLDVYKALGDGEFVRCVHSIGCPRPMEKKVVSHWPCNPEQTIIAHLAKERQIMSFGSCYGGNALLGKKCFALRIASVIARDEGWMAEHMLIMGVTNPQGKEKYIAAAFPSQCGKTNLAMLMPTLPGWKVRTVGDDIAWMRFDKDGRLHAINPEFGFFGVAPGTNMHTNPMAMEAIKKNTIFTNVASTEEGQVYWEGMEDEVPEGEEITSWKGEHWHLGEQHEGKAAHPNSRFCAPAGQCPTIHPRWEDPDGVPIDIIIFGGRRPEGVPLVFESFDWKHGVMVGANLKSQTTAAAEFKGKSIMHDPMAMRPFMGYNFGKYLQHWLNMEQPGRQMPKIFHVNWFLTDDNGKFLWPGFGDNIRVLDWMMKRVDNEEPGISTPIGLVPKEGSINMEGIEPKPDWEALFPHSKEFWLEEMAENKKYFDAQVGEDMPEVMLKEEEAQLNRIQTGQF